MSKAIIILIASLLTTTLFAETADSLDPLIKAYIQAINTKNTNALRELVYPACRNNLTDSEETQLKSRLDTDLNLTIPGDASIKVTEYAGYALYGDAAIWKARPTREIEIRYKVPTGGGKLMNRFAAKSDGKWYFVFPYVDENKLKKQPTSKDLQPLRNEEKVPQSSPPATPPSSPPAPDQKPKP